MSVLTPDGEEYVGPLTEVWIEPEFGQGALFDVLIAVTVVIAVIVVFILYMNRGKLIR
jgi:flagellar biosynthesis/type III secretory pathway M-ring protein FliF/YscJ